MRKAKEALLPENKLSQEGCPRPPPSEIAGSDSPSWHVLPPTQAHCTRPAAWTVTEG